MFGYTFRTIDQAARTAILLVHGKRDDERSTQPATAHLDKPLVVDASVLITFCAEHPTRDDTREKLRTALELFLRSERLVEHRCEALLHHLDNKSNQQFVEGASPCGDPHLIYPHCDAEPIDRALVWREREIIPTMNWWIEHDRRPLRTAAPRHRYLFLGQAGGEGERRDYLVFVQSALLTEREPHRGWMEQREPSVLKFRDHFYCDSFEAGMKAKAERNRRELLMCVVPLMPSEDPSAHNTALEQIKALLLGETAPAADETDDPMADEAEAEAAWLSLSRYADVFLGNGARKAILDAHLRSKLEPANKGQADPRTA